MQQFGYIKMFLISILFLVLVLLLPILIISNLEYFKFGITLFLGWIIVFYSGLKISILCYKNEKRLLELTFLVFVYVFMGLSAFTQAIYNSFPWRGYYSLSTINYGLIIVSIGILFYELGIYTGERKFTIKSIEDRKKNVFDYKSIKIFILLSLLLSILIVFINGGIGNLFLTRLEKATILGESEKSSYLLLNSLQKVPIFVCLLIVINITIKKPIKANIGLLIFLIFINMLISNPISNARYWFGTVILSIFMAILKWKKYSFFLWASGLLIMLLAIFPYADIFRYSTSDLKITVIPFHEQLIDNGDYDAFQQLLNTLEYVKDNGIVYGNQLIGSFLFWVPRSFWTDKPYGTGQTVAEHLNYSFTNFSSPLWAESYINFGLLGVMVLFYLYGYFTTFAQKKYIYDSKKKNDSIYLIIVPFLSGYQLFLLRGDLLNGVAYMSAFILFSVLFAKVKKFKKDVRD